MIIMWFKSCIWQLCALGLAAVVNQLVMYHYSTIPFFPTVLQFLLTFIFNFFELCAIIHISRIIHSIYHLCIMVQHFKLVFTTMIGVSSNSENGLVATANANASVHHHHHHHHHANLL